MNENTSPERFHPLMALLARISEMDFDAQGRAHQSCLRSWLPEKLSPEEGIWGRADEPLWTLMIDVDLSQEVGWNTLDRLATLLQRTQSKKVPVALELCPQEGWHRAGHLTFMLRGRCDPKALGEEWDRMYDHLQDERLAANDPPRPFGH